MKKVCKNKKKSLQISNIRPIFASAKATNLFSEHIKYIKMTTSKLTRIRKAAPVLASNLYRTSKYPITWGQALSYAWYVLRNEMSEFDVIEFAKKGGQVVKRVVSSNIEKFYSFKDSGRKAAKGLSKFIDASKVAYNIINDKKISLFTSCYKFEVVA